MSDLVCPWIDTPPGEMRCCGDSAPIVARGEYSDGIPHLRLPFDWFVHHRAEGHDPELKISTPTEVELKISTPTEVELKPDSEPAFSLQEPAPSVQAKKPAIPPISFEDARICTAADSMRILCGEPRDEVLRRRRAVLAGEETEDEEVGPLPDPVRITVKPHFEIPEYDLLSTTYTWINTSDAAIELHLGKHRFLVEPGEDMWLTPKTFLKHGFRAGQVTSAAELHRKYLTGSVQMTPRLVKGLRRAGIKL